MSLESNAGLALVRFGTGCSGSSCLCLQGRVLRSPRNSVDVRRVIFEAFLAGEVKWAKNMLNMQKHHPKIGERWLVYILICIRINIFSVNLFYHSFGCTLKISDFKVDHFIFVEIETRSIHVHPSWLSIPLVETGSGNCSGRQDCGGREQAMRRVADLRRLYRDHQHAPQPHIIIIMPCNIEIHDILMKILVRQPLLFR